MLETYNKELSEAINRIESAITTGKFCEEQVIGHCRAEVDKHLSERFKRKGVRNQPCFTAHSGLRGTAVKYNESTVEIVTGSLMGPYTEITVYPPRHR